MDELSIDQSILNAAEQILEFHGATTDAGGVPLKVLIPSIRQKIPMVSDSAVYLALLNAHKSQTGRIRSGGPWRGYHLLPEEKLPLSELGSNATYNAAVQPLEAARSPREHSLYPLVAEWLQTKKGLTNVSYGYANKKIGGKWGNPDIIGIEILDDYGFFDVEIVSAEIKLSSSDWKQFIFEAVSHKRFSERVYYIFRDSEPQSISFHSELYAYAEKFMIGIAVIELSDEELHRLEHWEAIPSAERFDFIDSIVEIIPAPLDYVSARRKIELLRTMGIYSKKSIYEFGRQDGAPPKFS